MHYSVPFAVLTRTMCSSSEIQIELEVLLFHLAALVQGLLP